jgi:hypothetical protein
MKTMKFMKTIKKVTILFAVIAMTIGCKKGDVPAEEMNNAVGDTVSSAVVDTASVDTASADSTSTPSPSSPTSTPSEKTRIPAGKAYKTDKSEEAVEPVTGDKKIIRTADLTIKVKDVTRSTYEIEDITEEFGGFVESANQTNEIIEQSKTEVSKDSILEITKYSVKSNIVIRVPSKNLSATIKAISRQIGSVDSYNIKADDVSLRMRSNELTQKRNIKTEKRVEKAIDTKGVKMKDVINAENDLAEKKEERDNARLENISMQDQVNFSTLSIQIYQGDLVKKELIANATDINSYKPSIGTRIADSLKSGWYVLANIIDFLFQIWWFIALCFGAFWLYKKYIKEKE